MTWTALDADSKLLVSWLVGGRDSEYAGAFITDVADRLANRVQLTSDGHKAEPKPCQVGGAVQVAALRYCLAQRARLVNMVTYAWYMPAMMRSGLPLRALGLPFEHEDMQLVACAGDVSARAISDMNAFYGLGDWPVLSRGLGDATAVHARRYAT